MTINQLDEYCRQAYKSGYNKAIDDFAEKLCYKIKSEIDDCADELQWIDKIAEQLKAGEENDITRYSNEQSKNAIYNSNIQRKKFDSVGCSVVQNE